MSKLLPLVPEGGVLLQRRIARSGWTTLLSLLWLCLVAALTATACAPRYLNADILLNSVMSLQHVTLFYWGQNRLLNVLPLLASVTSDPQYNLWLVILLPVVAFFLLLQAMTVWAARGLQAGPVVALQAFVVLSALVLLLLRPIALAEIAMGHIEYSLPALLVALALSLSWSVPNAGRIGYLLIGALLFVALGVNPAALLVLGFAVLGRLLYRRAIDALDVGLLAFAVLAFAFWMVVSRLVASTSYAGLSWRLLPDGVERVLSTLPHLLDPAYLPALALLLLASFLFRLPGAAGGGRAFERAAVLATVAFALVWVLLFCANRWVALNDFHWRYFIYPLFAAFLLLALRVLAFLHRLPAYAGWVTAVLLGLCAVLKVYQPPRAIAEFELLRQVQRVAPQPSGLYSGDYWLVWPAVWRDLMLGRSAYGLAYRGDANRDAARAQIGREIEASGAFTVLCLNALARDCLTWVKTFTDPLDCRQVEAVGTRAMLLHLRSGVIGVVGDEWSVNNSGCGLVGDAFQRSASGWRKEH